MKKIQLFLVILLASCLTVAAQDMRATGKVTFASDGDAVIGATVKVKGTQIVAITDINGSYTITLPTSAEKVLEVSYTGFKTVSIRIPQSGNYDVQLEEDALVLGGTEGLVVIGYGSPRRAGTVVGSSTKVESKAFESRPTASAFDALQGKVAGLQIFTSSGQPGTMQSVRLHGVGSLNSSTSPLYVLDGVPVGASTIMSLNPNDIENTTVLKDASATSIYGSRAANGVIYISTKRGAVGQNAQVTVSAYMGIAGRASDKFYDQLMHTDQMFDFLTGVGDGGRVLATQQQLMSQNIIDPNTGTFWDTKWIDYLQPHNYINNVDISVRGGSEKVSYYVSASNFHQGGTVPGTSYDRMTIRSNVEAKANDYLRIGMTLALSSAEQRSQANYSGYYLAGAGSYALAPYYSPYDYNLNIPDNIPGLDMPNTHYLPTKQKDKTRYYTLTGSAFLEIEPIKNLKLKSQVGTDFTISQRKRDWMASYLNAGDGSVSRTSDRYVDLSITNTAEYSFDFADKHSIILLAGHEGLRRSTEGFSVMGRKIKDDYVMQISAADPTLISGSSGYSNSRLLSYFGRVEYQFDDRLFFEGSVRNDKSSRFAKGHNRKTFWSVGGRWNLKNEKWLKNVSMVNDLTFKASYGTAGNEEIMSSSSTGRDFASWMLVGIRQYAGDAGWYLGTPGNQNLTWETQEKFTTGISATLWSKLSVELEYYRRTTKDLLIHVPLPYTTGFDSYLGNVGELRNQGIDIQLSYTPLSGKDYYLTLNANFNYNKQEMTKLFDGRDSWYDANYSRGYSIGNPVEYWMPVFAGIDPTDGAPTWYLPGDDIAKTNRDRNNTTKNFNEDDLKQNSGKPWHAPYAGGFGLDAHWKGIGFNIDFTFALGKYVVNNDKYFLMNYKASSNRTFTNAINDYWKNPGDVTEYPDWKNYSREVFDTHLLENSSFMRLKNISLSYDFKKEWLKKTGFLEGAQIYIKARNLWTINHSSFSGIDPEVDINIALGRIVNPREVVIGVKLTF